MMIRLFLLNFVLYLATAYYVPEQESIDLETRATSPVVAGNCPNPPIQSDPCRNYGTCITAPGNSHTCKCKAGWGGASCETDTGSILGESLFTDNGVTIWGEWASIAQCKKGFFAIGFAVRFEGEQGGGDDTAINQFKLICGPPDGTRSGLETHIQGLDKWGAWTEDYYCPYNYFMVSFNQQIDPDSGPNHDDWGVAKYYFTCRGPGLNGDVTSKIESNTGGIDWGKDGSSNSNQCKKGDAICGFKARTVGSQGWAAWQDDVAMVDTVFYCCPFEHQPSRYLLNNLKFYIDDSRFLNSSQPQVVSKATIENRSSQTVTVTKELSATKSTTTSLSETLGLSATVSAEITVGSESKGVAASVGVSVETSYSTTWGKSITTEANAKLTVGVSIAPNTLGEIEMILLQGITDIPYTADITTTYLDGTPSDTRSIKGTWKNVRTIRIYAKVPAGVTINSESVSESPIG